ncbi:quinon protein alcohol dehydrogenase-like superfamily, partial [Entophlyctis helioformis]
MSIASVQHGYVFGIKNDIPDNIFYVEENTILYPAGSNIIIANVEQKSQRFIPISEPGDGISAVSVSADRHVFAVAEKSHRPSIHIYDLHNYRKRRQLLPIEGTHAKEFVSLSFSIDSKYLAAQLSEPDWVLHYYAWEKGKPIATISASPSPDQPVNQVTINPFDGTEFCVTGKGFVTIYRYSEGVLRPLHVRLPPYNYLCHCWMTMDRVVVGTQEGYIFMIANGEMVQQAVFGEGNAIAALQNMKQGFAVGGVGGYVSIYEFMSPDWSSFEQTRRIPLPDTELIITGMTSTTSEGTLLVELDSNQIYKIALTATDLAKPDDLKFEVFSESNHHGAVTGLDLCIRKPLLVTCSPDKSIRIWNYQTGTCELVKYFTEEAHSVALHPSGLYLLAGFSDKLRLMNVLMDDLRPVREFGIRACKECRFSNGGHSFAAAHGNIIQI